MAMTGVLGFHPDSTPEQQIAQLKREVDHAFVLATEARGKAQEVDDRLDRHQEEVGQQMSRLRQDLDESVQRLTLEGLPVAALGLAMAAAGLLVQAVSPVFG